jgi:hypothetical protein
MQLIMKRLSKSLTYTRFSANKNVFQYAKKNQKHLRTYRYLEAIVTAAAVKHPD